MLPVVPDVPYADPWLLPVGARLRMLTTRRRRVAYFYERPNNSTFRYRAYNMVQVLNALAQEEDVSASYFFNEDRLQFDEIANVADVLVICRSRYSSDVSHLVMKFKARRKRVLFDVDDLVFDTRYTHLLVRTLGLDTTDDRVWDDWYAMLGRLGATLALCDGAIGTNDLLACRLSEQSGLPARVVPNFLNPEQMEISDRVFALREAHPPERSDKVYLGYFSGSPSHRLDYALVEEALAELMHTDERLRLVVVGYIDTTGALAGLESRVEKVPFQDYVNLQRYLGAVHFNLMPLQHNEFTNCKSELKYFDAAVVGTLSVASPTYTYSRAIDHGRTGYLANATEWTRVLRQALDQMGNYRSMARAARDDAQRKFAWTGQKEAILHALGFMA